MSLFQNSVLKPHLSNLDENIIQQSWKIYQSYFLDPSKQKIIFEKKEEELQYEFLMQLFDKCLGYDIGVGSQNLFVEQKNQTDSKKADGAIKIKGEIVCVIELKSTKTKNLKDVEIQAFGYKVSHPKCKYVVTSNFNKLRFYVDNTTEFEEFDLFNLTNDRFKLLWLCLSYDSISSNKPQKLSEESLVNEEKITKNLYKDYSEFRRKLFTDLKENNPQIEPEVLLQKTQKLLDRLLFILFCEDRGLLPSNSISEINRYWDKKKAFGDDETLYNTYVTYFNVINKGRPQRDNKEAIYAYNGGLFQEDKILDKLVISDDLFLDYSKKLTAYDFESEVSVNILGHIFEHSLSELEDIQNEIEGVEVDKSKSKRKKDGVFYTPQYITKYIVENTVGKLCEEKKIELNINENEYLKSKKGRPEKKLKSLLSLLEQYREWLLSLTICDPACGSGAFLNQALEFLIAEHNYIDELRTSLMGESIQFSDIENSILENNLYGVDINKESVEIAKLSLWLRTAQKGRKLTSLNNNIKCGNSLIDDQEVAGDKAFNWKKGFSDVFEKGGFDVVIGNPPYLRKQGLMEYYPELCHLYEKTFTAATGNYDIYALFMEKSFGLINQKGIVSFILPHKFLIADFGAGIRQFFIDKKAVSELKHFGAELVFRDASTYTCIINLTKEKKEVIKFNHLNPSDLFKNIRSSDIQYSELSNKQWILSDKKVSVVLKKINLQPLKLKDVFTRFVQGIITGKDLVFCVNGVLEEQFLIITDKEGVQHKIEKEILKPHIRGKDVNKYISLINNEWLIFPYVIKEGKAELIPPSMLENKYPNTFNYLKGYEDILRKREKGKFSGDYWYQYSRNQALSMMETDKIITPEFCFGGSMTLDENNFYHNSKCHTLILKENCGYTYKSILPLINSSLFWFYLSNTGNVLRGGYIGVKRKVLEPFSLPNLESLEIEQLEKFTYLMLEKKSQQHSVSNDFIKYLKSQIKIESESKKIQNWYQLDFGEFTSELNKAIKKRGGGELDDIAKYSLMSLFEAQKSKVEKLKAEIDKADKEIDQMVYELYDLTKEEIEIVENS